MPLEGAEGVAGALELVLEELTHLIRRTKGGKNDTRSGVTAHEYGRVCGTRGIHDWGWGRESGVGTFTPRPIKRRRECNHGSTGEEARPQVAHPSKDHAKNKDVQVARWVELEQHHRHICRILEPAVGMRRIPVRGMGGKAEAAQLIQGQKVK